jgi:hypothetical protein
MPKETTKLNLKENLRDKYVAFIDVMGFKELVYKGNTDNLESYFSKITMELDGINNDKKDIESFLISDSIILIAPDSIYHLRQLLTAIRRIQNALLGRKTLVRGAVSFGEIYYNKDENIVVGKGFIKAYLLESEAIFPRVIIDPSIIGKMGGDKTNFLEQLNASSNYDLGEGLIYTKSDFSQISDDSIFINYANKVIGRDKINENLKKTYDLIKNNLYGEQKLYTKYVWLRDYFTECLKLTESASLSTTAAQKNHKIKLKEWIERFERL